MFDVPTMFVSTHDIPASDSSEAAASTAEPAGTASLTGTVSPMHFPSLDGWFSKVPLQRRRVRRKQWLFRAGEPRRALFLIQGGCFKMCLLSEDGREKVTGFRMRGDLLGLDALDGAVYTCDAVALDVGEVWELPAPERAHIPEFQCWVTAALAREIRRDWQWMLMLSSFNAEQRVVAFLLDLAARFESLGFSTHHLLLRMTRADLGSFLALQLETVTRALSHLDALGLIAVSRSEIRIDDRAALQALLGLARRCR